MTQSRGDLTQTSGSLLWRWWKMTLEARGYHGMVIGSFLWISSYTVYVTD